VQPCMTALASVSAPESDKNQIGPGFEAPAEENAEILFHPILIPLLPPRILEHRCLLLWLPI